MFSFFIILVEDQNHLWKHPAQAHDGKYLLIFNLDLPTTRIFFAAIVNISSQEELLIYLHCNLTTHMFSLSLHSTLKRLGYLTKNIIVANYWISIHKKWNSTVPVCSGPRKKIRSGSRCMAIFNVRPSCYWLVARLPKPIRFAHDRRETKVRRWA